LDRGAARQGKLLDPSNIIQTVDIREGVHESETIAMRMFIMIMITTRAKALNKKYESVVGIAVSSTSPKE